MPDNNTLESLNIEINGSSQKASEGVSSLIGSLRSLARSVGTIVPALRALNSELKTLSRYGNMKLPNLSGIAGMKAGMKKSSSYPYDPATNNNRAVDVSKLTFPNKVPDAVWQQQYNNNVATQYYKKTVGKNDEFAKYFRGETNTNGGGRYFQPEINRYKELLGQMGDEKFAKMVGMPVDEMRARFKYIVDTFDKTASSAKNATTAIKETAQATKTAGNAAETAKPKMNGFLSTIGRIAKTMLIRTALRALMKSFSEAWNAAYQYSKAMGGDFAKSVDTFRGALSSVATSLISTFSPVLSAVMPIINTLATGINYLCTLLQRLFSLLGFGSGLFGVSAKEIDKYAKSSSGGSKATKNLLASWDQLNVIQSQGGGGGGGGGAAKSYFEDLVSDSMAGVNMIVAESMLAIGLILACTGHIGIGVGLMAIGAASIAKTLFEDWSKLPSEIKKSIAEITAIAGASMLAIGVILACTGHVGLGVGLMALGALNIGAIMGVTNGNALTDTVKQTILKIMVIASLGLMAIGLIVALMNPVLGIGMIVAGAGLWYASMSYAGGSEPLLKIVEGLLGDIKDAFWKAVIFVEVAWGKIADWFNENVWQPIVEFAASAWDSIGVWFIGVGDTISKAWESVIEFFKNLFGSTEIPGSIADFANNAWVSISTWWTEDVVGFFTSAWEGITSFFDTLLFGADGQGGIAGFFETAWESISNLWGDITTKVSKAWGKIGTWFYNNVTMPVGNFFVDCINGIIDGINWLIGVLNSIHITIPAVELPLIGRLWGETTIGISGIALVEKLERLQAITENADGAYGIPRGDLFIANERGAELVGSMNGKTTVANQGQIIEGIQRGVRDANEEQNALLRRQNELLVGILEKSGNIELRPSAEWGKFNQRSYDMWATQTGR